MTSDVRERAVLVAAHKDLYIGGEWTPATSGKTFEVEDPATV